MRRVYSCNLSLTLVRGPVHTLYPPVRLPTDRLAILDEPSAYHTKVLFATFPETALVLALLPWHARDATAVVLFAVWPLFLAGREAFIQSTYILVGWAVLHAAIANDITYGVPVENAVRVGAVGGALIMAIFLFLFSILPFFVRTIKGIPHWQPAPTPPPIQKKDQEAISRRRRELSMTRLLLARIHYAIMIAPSEMAYAAAAAALGTAVLRHAMADASSLMDVTHAVRAAVVGAALLYPPQAVWYLLSLYLAWPRFKAYVEEEIFKLVAAQKELQDADSDASRPMVPWRPKGMIGAIMDVECSYGV